MRAPLHDEEWDGAWARHDRSMPAAPAAAPRPAVQTARGRKPRSWIALVLVALTLPSPTHPLPGDGATRGIPREALFSLSPAEVMLPPLDVAIARLSAESASASCWVLQLRPQGGGCPERAASR